MIQIDVEDAETTINSPVKIEQKSRLKIRVDENARRRVADTDGTRRRAAQTVKDNEIL